MKLSVKIENYRYQIASLPTNLTRLVSMNFKGGNLRIFQNLKSLTLFINENLVGKLKLPLSLVYLKIHSNDDMPPSLFHSLSTLKRLQTLIVDNRKQVEYTFHVDTAVFSRNIKILQLKNIATSISSIYDCEELTQLKYLELRLTEAGETFHHMSFTYPSSLKTLIIHFQLSFTDLEYVLSGCVEGNLKHLELYSQTNTSQMDYFDQKRWCKLFERFQNLTKCRIQLQQRGRRGAYNNVCRGFAQELKRIKELKEKWNMECSLACPGYHGVTVYVQISANL
ncbi:unnamed protein product [Rotaria sordida]|uniref:Uncharacterized protein n=1 Tax=Rotaria sordida TaxID=392033 RepID=A0A814JZ65_9BILA|nr:unnamed protein product [Rotaria sordida]CAF1505664.1 unnamed protein product [Rotaria sordida]CAF4020544.1 unnamed protein product [Rotaria sordida]CAF4090732.1 unnamed protein product [Rotaria sordida]